VIIVTSSLIGHSTKVSLVWCHDNVIIAKNIPQAVSRFILFWMFYLEFYFEFLTGQDCPAI
jgi:hypothetical protein